MAKSSATMFTPSPTETQAGSTSTIAPAHEQGTGPAATISQIQRLAWSLVKAEPAPVHGLALTRVECNQLEETTGLGTTRTGPELVRAVERLASMKIGDIRIPFTPGQLAELQHRAHKRGRSLEEEMRAVVRRIEDELFYKGG